MVPVMVLDVMIVCPVALQVTGTEEPIGTYDPVVANGYVPAGPTRLNSAVAEMDDLADTVPPMTGAEYVRTRLGTSLVGLTPPTHVAWAEEVATVDT